MKIIIRIALIFIAIALAVAPILAFASCFSEDAFAADTVEAAVVAPDDVVETVETPVEEPEPEVIEVVEYPKLYTDNDAIIIAKMVYGEARGVQPMTTSNGTYVSTEAQWAAVVWTVLNRVDAGYGYIELIVTAPKQYVGYRAGNPVDERILEITYDVLDRWNREKHGETDVGRVLPPDYLWFNGKDGHNHFRNAFKTSVRWDWSLEDPYV